MHILVSLVTSMAKTMSHYMYGIIQRAECNTAVTMSAGQKLQS